MPEEIAPANGELLLVVDDEPKLLDSLRSVLLANKYTVLTARNGIEALETFSERRDNVKLVLIDFHMPFMSGKSTIEAMRKTDRLPPIIVMSGFLTEELKEDLKPLGITAFLDKPFSSRDLLESFRDAFQPPR